MAEYSKLQIWMLASRPKTLPAAIGPVLVGSAFAIKFSQFEFFPAFAALFGAVMLQIIANVANDYFDFIKGHDDEKRVGPTRVIASGLMSIKEVQIGLVVLIAIVVLDGLYLISVGGPVILAIGFFSILFSVIYSGGPFPLASNALGDLFVFIFFGLVAVCGTYYVQALELTSQVIIGSIPVGLLITAILVVNNYRDIETDRQTGKLTTSVILGIQGSRIYYLILIYGSFLVPIILLIFYSGYSPLILLPFLSIPLSLKPVKIIFSDIKGPALNEVLAATARLSLIYSLLFSLGITF